MIQLYRFRHISLYAFRGSLLSFLRFIRLFPHQPLQCWLNSHRCLSSNPCNIRTTVPLRKSYTTSVHTTAWNWQDSEAPWSSESCADDYTHNFRPFLQINLTKGKKYHTLKILGKSPIDNVPFVLYLGQAVDSVCVRTTEQLEAISMYTEFQGLVMRDTPEEKGNAHSTTGVGADIPDNGCCGSSVRNDLI
jgi:hypothetical protein